MNNDMNLTRHKVYKEGTEGGRSRTNIKDMQTKFVHASKCGKNGKRLSWESERAEILFAVILAMYKKKATASHFTSVTGGMYENKESGEHWLILITTL